MEIISPEEREKLLIEMESTKAKLVELEKQANEKVMSIVLYLFS